MHDLVRYVEFFEEPEHALSEWKTHAEEITVPLPLSPANGSSERSQFMSFKDAQWVRTSTSYDLDWHVAPRRQYVVTVAGEELWPVLVDKGQSKRTVNALTRRIAFSVALILLVALGIWTGMIKPHGIGG